MTPQVVPKHLGEGENGRIVHSGREGWAGYFQVVPRYDWVSGDPVRKGKHLEWLAAKLEGALRSLRHS